MLATSSYEHPKWPRLDLRSEIDTWTSWLCADGLGDRRFARLYAKLAEDPYYRDVVDALADTAEIRESDAVVLVATGHGTDLGHAHRMVLRNGDPTKPDRTMMRSDQLIGLLRDTGVEHALVVIDACQAGSVSRAMFDFADDLPKGWVGIATSAAKGISRVQAVTDAVRSFLRPAQGDDRDGSALQPYLSPRALVDAITDAVGDQDVVVFPRHPRDEPHPCLPNPRFVGQHADQVATAPTRQDMAIRREDLEAHWGPRSRGVQHGDQAGWLFTGRAAAMSAVVATARGAPGAYVVSGGAGCGKSAVLSRLVTLSDPRFRAEYAELVSSLDPAVCPAPGDVTVAVLAQRKTSREVLDQLCAALEIGPIDGPQVDALRARIAATRPTIVVDALDEAANPWELLREVLTPLCVDWSHPPLRLLVGVRSAAADDDSPTRTLSGAYVVALQAQEIRLDSDPYWEPGDLHDYVVEILSTDPSPYRDRTQATRLAHTVAQLVGRSYLVAQIVARSLASCTAPQDPDDEQWRAMVADGLASVLVEELMSAFDDVEDRDRAVSVLQAAALAFGQGVPWRRTWPTMATALAPPDAVIGDADIHTVLGHRIGGYLVRSLEAGTTVYRPFHDALRQALVSPALGRLNETASEGTMHARVAAALRSTVPIGADGQRDWDGAAPYVLRYLASHAARAGELEDLLLDQAFVLAADPDNLAATVSAARGPDRNPRYAAVLRAMDVMRAADVPGRPSYLALAGMIEGVPELAGVDTGAQPWSPRWVSWTQAPASALLGDLKSAIVGLGIAEIATGPLLVAASANGDVHAVDAITGALRWSRSLGTPTLRAAVSADGALVIAALKDSDVVALHTFDGADRWRVPHAEPKVAALAAGRVGDADVLFTGTHSEGFDSDEPRSTTRPTGFVRRWTITTGAELAWRVPVFGAGVRSLELAGQHLLVAGDPYREPYDQRGLVRMLDPATGAVRAELLGEVGDVMASATWCASERVALVSTYQRVVRWDPADGSVRSEPNPRWQVGCADHLVALDHAKRRLVAMNGWHEICLLDLADLHRLDQPGTNRVVATALAGWSDGTVTRLYSGHSDGDLRSWDVGALTSGAARMDETMATAVDASEGIVFQLVRRGGTNEKTLECRDLSGGGLRAELPTTPSVLVFATAGAGLVLLADGGGVVEARRTADLDLVWRSRLHDRQITDLRVAGDVVVSVANDHALRCTSLAHGTPLCPHTRVSGWQDKGFSNVEVIDAGGGACVVAGGTYYGLAGWGLDDLLVGQPLGPAFADESGNDATERHVFQAHEDVATLSTLRVGGREILLCVDCHGMRLTLIDLDRRISAVWSGHDRPVTAASQADAFVWTGDDDGVVRAWSVADLLTPDRRPEVEIELGSRIRSVHGLPDGGVVISTSDGLVRLDLPSSR